METVVNDLEGTYDLLRDLAINKLFGGINYFLWGVVTDVLDNATSVSPTLCKEVWILIVAGGEVCDNNERLLTASLKPKGGVVRVSVLQRYALRWTSLATLDYVWVEAITMLFRPFSWFPYEISKYK
jgi:hypothetical protein